MGMYTGLRGSIRFFSGLVKLMKEYDELKMWKEGMGFWSYVHNKLPSSVPPEIDSAIGKWLGQMRCDFIPRGTVCYMPYDWDEDTRPYWVKGTMHFTCSLKNYNQEIEEFVNEILPKIAVSWDLESRYEEAEESKFYKKDPDPEVLPEDEC